MRRSRVYILALAALGAAGVFAQATGETGARSSQPAASVSAPASVPAVVRKDRLHTILSTPEFAKSRLSLTERLGRAIIRMGSRAMLWLFGNAPDIAAPSLFIGRVLAVVLIVLFLLLLAYVLSRIGASGILARSATESKDEYAGPDSPRLALDEAARMALAGDFRSALRLVYLAVLLKLDEREMIRFDRTGTNWEYLATLRKHPTLHRALRPVTLTFDHKWYGHEPATESDYEAFLDAYRAAESAEVAG